MDIMTRLPELVEQQDPTAVPDAAQQSEIDDLTRAVPRVIELLPDVLTDKTDVRHKVALNEMVSGLVKLMDRIRPFALVCLLAFLLLHTANDMCMCSHIVDCRC